jgi:PII-like signaling protein
MMFQKEVIMQLPQEGLLLRIFIGEADRHEHKPLYEWIVLKAREQGLAGATVLRGMMGFGANTRQIHTFRFDTLSEDLPVIIEIVDTPAKLEPFLDLIEPHIIAGLITLEKAHIKFYHFEKRNP